MLAQGNKDEKQMENLQAIESYYIKPHLQRSATVMFFSFITLISGLFAQFYSHPKYDKIFSSLAYGIMSFNIIISELIINQWRKTRDRTLGDNYS